MTRHQIRQKMRKQMLKWGMHEDEIALCMIEVKQRQTLKEQGKLDRDAPLCTRPAFRIYRREFNRLGDTHLDVLTEKVLDALW